MRMAMAMPMPAALANIKVKPAEMESDLIHSCIKQRQGGRIWLINSWFVLGGRGRGRAGAMVRAGISGHALFSGAPSIFLLNGVRGSKHLHMAKALPDDSWKPDMDAGVPDDQKPANELAALKEGPLYSWAQLSPLNFSARLGGLWLFFFLFLGAPIAAGSFEPYREPVKFFIAGGAGALFTVALVVLRLYLGWSYVGNRLFSAVVPYEETGWYDGQLWVKPPEVLARDRLLGAYQVKPVMEMLKRTLLASAALLTTATVSLLLILPNDTQGVLDLPSSAMAADGKILFRKNDLLSPPKEVIDDDQLAAAAAAAANGRPVYCSDRYYRALAGGQYCKWEDLKK